MKQWVGPQIFFKVKLFLCSDCGAGPGSGCGGGYPHPAAGERGQVRQPLEAPAAAAAAAAESGGGEEN